jgi:hypothetical protein
VIGGRAHSASAMSKSPESVVEHDPDPGANRTHSAPTLHSPYSSPHQDLVRIRSEATIATTFLATLSLKTIPPEMLKVTISKLFKRFHGHAAARKSEVIDFQSTFDLGALFTLKD